MGIGPGELTTPVKKRKKRVLQEPADTTEGCVTWESAPEAIRRVEGMHELQKHRLIPASAKKSYFAAYANEEKLFGFFFPLFINEEVPNCLVCLHWDPFRSIQENSSGPLYFVLTSAAYIEPLEVLPYVVLDRNMDDEVTSDEVAPRVQSTSSDVPKAATAPPTEESIMDSVGNFFPMVNGSDDQMENADIVFINSSGELFPMTWAGVRKEIARDRMLAETVKVLVLHNNAKYLPAFMSNRFVV